MSRANDQLNRLLGLLESSFARYLTFAHPRSNAAHERIRNMLGHMASDQQQLSSRIANFLLENGGSLASAEFPMDFTDTHDLAIDFLVRRTIEYQKQDIADLERIVDSLRLAPAALPLAEEALGMARGHLQLLDELAEQPLATP